MHKWGYPGLGDLAWCRGVSDRIILLPVDHHDSGGWEEMLPDPAPLRVLQGPVSVYALPH